MGVYGSNYPYGDSPRYKDEGEGEPYNYRHYPRMRQIGNYDEIFPLTNGNYHIDLKVKSKQLDYVDDDAILLYKEIFPDTATAAWMLPWWENLLGLIPPAGATEQVRQHAVVAKLRTGGGMAKSHFKKVAAGLQYNYGQAAATPRIWFVEGSQYKAFRAGYSRAGDQVWDQTSTQHEHVVEIWGTNVETDVFLINIFNTLRCVGVTFVFIDE